jgi:beta-glucosidase
VTDPTTFPTGFLWGAASAAHQIEGGNVNADIWPLEWQAGGVFAEPSGDACDSYHRYPEDIGLLAEAGLDTYRFSVEWARIEPEQGFFSRAALDHYRRVVASCLERGLTPLVTLHHFTAPRWFAERGGWSADGAADLFGRYVERVTAHVGDLVPFFCTINEANVVSVLQVAGTMPAGTGDSSSSAILQHILRSGFPYPDVEVMAAAHRRAVDAIRSGPGSAQVGWSLALVDYQAAPGGEDRCAATTKAAQLDWLDVSAADDYVGVQTYTRALIGPDGPVPPPEGAPTMQMDWEIYPDALQHTVRLAAGHAGVPVVVTEHGMATADDAARIEFTAAGLRGLLRCLDDGVDVRGYIHWTLLDNFEWMAGYKPTFGLIAVDRDDFTRTPKPSLAWLGGVARAGRLPLTR